VLFHEMFAVVFMLFPCFALY